MISSEVLRQRLSRQVARAIGAEDIRPRQYIAISEVVHRSVDWCSMFESGPVREVRFAAWPEQVEPLRVVVVCLPLMVVRTAQGEHRTLDVRQLRLLELPASFGRRAMQALAQRPAEPSEPPEPPDEGEDGESPKPVPSPTTR